MNKPIYFDYAATTPVDPRVAEKMMDCLTFDGNFGNPASRSHSFGWQAEELVDIARTQIADAIGADHREVIFTSGATEANNLALKGIVEASQSESVHIITIATEHKAVLDACTDLERGGVSVTRLKPNIDGLISIEQLKAAINDHTLLVSVMAVNNETGVVQDLSSIANLCQSRNILLHIDAAQAMGKIELDMSKLPVDLLSLSAHKVYGPKGIGALFVRRKPGLKLHAQIHGGGHERGMRSGTLATHQIVGMGEAFALATNAFEQESKRHRELTQRLWEGVSKIDGVTRNGSHNHCCPNILNISIAGVDGETLLMSIPGIAVSSGSACNSATVEPSFVLRAMGIDDDLAQSAIRLSVGRFTTESDIDFAVEELGRVIEQLRVTS